MIDLAWWDFAALEGLRADDRLRVLSREAMAVMFRLVLVARAGGEVPYLNHHSGAQSVAVYDLRESDTTATRDACARAVKELVDVGLVILDDAARVIRLDLHAGVLAREAPAADVADPGGPRRPPSHSPERNALRKLRYQFAHRAGPFRGVEVPDGATWETWSVSAEGVAFLARWNKVGNKAEQGRNNPGNKAGTTRNNPEQAPSLTLSPPENKGNEEKKGAREASQEQGGTTPGNNPRNKAEQPRTRRAPRAPAADTIPLPGSPEREVYDAITSDSVLCPITGNPGDFAARAVGGMFPNLTGREITAEVRRAGAQAAAKPPGYYSDGRRYLTNWLREEDARAAARPRPAQAQPAAPPKPRPRDDSGDRPRGPVLSAQQRAAASREFIAALKSPITEDA